MTLITASTAIGERREECCETTLELSEVAALCNSDCLSVSFTGILILVRISLDLAAAFWNDSEMMVGWMPLARSLEEASNKAPAITTTVVVPSPASTSWAFDNSTSFIRRELHI